MAREIPADVLEKIEALADSIGDEASAVTDAVHDYQTAGSDFGLSAREARELKEDFREELGKNISELLVEAERLRELARGFSA